jgi:DNA polymerase IV (DinB-like DNA polymerase)
MNNIIFHCDLDCFFAAVEMRENPEYRGFPVIIGADPKGGKGRGVISTCSYEARQYGLHSGMPISHAFKLCPHGIYLRPNFSKYHTFSQAVHKILKNYAPDHYQKVGLDEAYLDVTDYCANFEEAKLLADKIREDISKNIGITISIGCSWTKSLAKIASDYKKPNNTTIITPKNMVKLLENMDITKIPGIGKKSKKFYYKKGIITIGDIIKTPLHKIIEYFGKNGRWIWNVVHGFDDREVKELPTERKSISKERTFLKDTSNFNEILDKLDEINNKLHIHIEKDNIYYRTVALKIRFEGFITYTRSKTFTVPIRDKNKALSIILDLFNKLKKNKKKVRLVGIRFSNLSKDLKIKQTNLLRYVIS